MNEGVPLKFFKLKVVPSNQLDIFLEKKMKKEKKVEFEKSLLKILIILREGLQSIIFETVATSVISILGAHSITLGYGI